MLSNIIPVLILLGMTRHQDLLGLTRRSAWWASTMHRQFRLYKCHRGRLIFWICLVAGVCVAPLECLMKPLAQLCRARHVRPRGAARHVH